MKKLIFCFTLVCTGLFVSCIDKNEEVDESTKPSWLGGSIYSELNSPSSGELKGTFKTYLRLIDDLGYAETLNRTGSKTVFPANDEAFERFFAPGGNPYGVTSYEQLTESQKKQLLYSSMLDNALLTSLLPNVNNGSTVTRGAAIKHATNLSVIDTVAHVYVPSALYPNNPYWTRFDSKGIYTVSDATVPMMVHFTRDYMINNEITTSADASSDFSIIAGEPYDGTSTYIFRNKVIVPDVTCQNGYIHQMEDVVTPPGSMAQMLKDAPEFSLFSRMLDRFAVPVYNPTVTVDYQDWALQNGRPAPDSIFEVRYLSENSQGVPFDNNGLESSENLLPFDPGWNGYYELNNFTSTLDASIMTIGAMFVPDDEALKDYFLNGSGAAIISENAIMPNTEENLLQNMDSIPLNMVRPLLSNLMKSSFSTTVPSKFSTVTNDVSDQMGLTTNDLRGDGDGGYDIRIANNGVIYRLNRMIPPVSYSAVSAPALIRNNMQIMRWAITNKTSDNPSLKLDYYAYLQAMKAKFALFIPSDQAFDFYYIDPASLGHSGTSYPQAVHYYRASTRPFMRASIFKFDPETNTIDRTDSVDMDIATNIDKVVAQWTDILNYHTLVFNSDDNPTSGFTGNKYYKTKHGGEIMINGTGVGSQVVSGAQIDNGYTAPNIEEVFNMDNGTTFQIDRIIQGPVESVYKVIKENAGAEYNTDGAEYESDKFSEFFALCDLLDDTELLDWAGISTVRDEETGITESDRYTVFDAMDGFCLDQNVSFFNTYNYTVYVPNNDAMQIAFNNGLPSREKIENWYSLSEQTGLQWPADSARRCIDVIRDFIRYHFQRVSVYADQTVHTSQYNNEFSTFLVDDLGIGQKIGVTGGDNKLNVVDKAGVTHVIDANNSSRLVNKMTRDFTFNAARTSAAYFTTSSFAVLHELSEPLYYSSDKRFDKSFTDLSAAKRHKFNHLR